MSIFRWAALSVCSLIPALLMTGCSPKEFKDGSYRAEASDYDQYGWKDYVQLTVSDGKVTKIEFDALHEQDSVKKSEDLKYQQQYREAGLGTDPADYSTRLEDSYLEAQKSSSIDSVSGATISTGRFKQLTKALEKRMEMGETGTITVTLE